MYEIVDNHGFGERVQLTKTLGSNRGAKYVKVRYVPDEESEEVKRIKKKWKEIKENRTKSV
jgi:hypothetical protein